MNFVDRIGEMIGASKRKARYKERMTTTRQIFDTNTWWKNWFGANVGVVKFRSRFTLEWRAYGKIGRVLVFVYSPKNLLRERNNREVKDMRNI